MLKKEHQRKVTRTVPDRALSRTVRGRAPLYDSWRPAIRITRRSGLRSGFGGFQVWRNRPSSVL